VILDLSFFFLFLSPWLPSRDGESEVVGILLSPSFGMGAPTLAPLKADRHSPYSPLDARKSLFAQSVSFENIFFYQVFFIFN